MPRDDEEGTTAGVCQLQQLTKRGQGHNPLGLAGSGGAFPGTYAPSSRSIQVYDNLRLGSGRFMAGLRQFTTCYASWRRQHNTELHLSLALLLQT